MTQSAQIHRLPDINVDVRRTVCAYVRAGYPVEEIADVIGVSVIATHGLIRRMRREGWDLHRPRGAQHHVKVANRFLRDRYLRFRARARGTGDDLTPGQLGRLAGLTGPTGTVDSTYIQRLLGLSPMPDGHMRVTIPLDAALALGAALAFDPHEVEAHERRPDPNAIEPPVAAAA